ncbi:MAG: hypothetical protein QM726_12615 [Chitinophagaceae bacterium]
MNTAFKIVNLVDGDMLHANDGLLRNGYLLYPVEVKAPEAAKISINGVAAKYTEGVFTAKVLLENFENSIEIKEETSGEKETITIYKLDHFAGKYRLSIDDNIWFLQDIYQNEHRYTSIFDNSYLAFLKRLHEQYGTKVHLNLFYQTDGFNLSQLSDKYKAEWTAQADWLRLSFHAIEEFPDMPYKNASYETVKKDCDLVMAEIKRFAGEALMGPITTLHWGESNAEGARALKDAGYKGLLGYFNVDDDLFPASYYLSVDQRRHLKKRFIWKDPATEIVLIKTSIVLDKTDLKDIVPHLDSYENKSGKQPPYVDLLVHEQYYYPFYFNYEPDYCQRIETAVQWAVKNGYTPEFLGDSIFK